MTTTSKPDIANYLTRLTEIEELLVSGSHAATTPTEASWDYPFWLHIAGTTNLQKEASNIYFMSISVRALLVRGASPAMGDFAIESSIQSDMVDVVWGFVSSDNYRNLKTPTYTTIQAGYVLDSLMITNVGRWEGSTIAGDVIGSIYTFTFDHRMFNTP